MRHLNVLWLVTLPILAVILAGCTVEEREEALQLESLEKFQRPDKVNVSADQYILQPPDTIVVDSTRIPEINGSELTIRPDGKVSLETVGEIEVAGKTPREVAQLIAERLSNLYTLPGENSINVKVSTFQSKYYYVVGQVDRGGLQVYNGRNTVLSAVAMAIPNVRAWEEKIQVIRPSAEGYQSAEIFTCNYDRMIMKGDLSRNVLLQEGDIVYVPPTILGAVGMTLEEVAGPFLTIAGAANTLDRSFNDND